MPTSASGLNNCAAPSHVRLWPVSVYKPTLPGRLCSNSKPPGASFHGVRALNAKLRALVVPHGPAQVTGRSELPATEPGYAHGRPARISWARLLKRVFQIDLEHCPNCGGQIKIIAAILEAPVIERILTHLGLQARAPPRVPARGDLQQAA